ncbi:hypothetical protein Tco_0869250 [Tanacetum coccineum]
MRCPLSLKLHHKINTLKTRVAKYKVESKQREAQSKNSNDGQEKSIQNVHRGELRAEEDSIGDTQCGRCGGKFNTNELWDVTCVKDGITIGINYGGISYWS